MDPATHEALAGEALAVVAAHLRAHGGRVDSGGAALQDAARAVCVVAAVVASPSERAAALVELVEPALYQRIVEGPLLDKVPGAVAEPDHYYQTLLEFELSDDGTLVKPSTQRRSRGSHYTDPELAFELARRTLLPVLAKHEGDLLEIAVCDPAVGAGAFLRAARSVLLEHAASVSTVPPPVLAERITQACLFGVDSDRLALWLARRILGMAHSSGQLAHGSALGGATATLDLPGFGRLAGVNWKRAFPRVFERANPGFDAIVGNPPWVAYVGRAAQPLDRELARAYAERYSGFRGYKTLHGLFVEQSARLLRREGRLGLVLPTSIADLAGYAATRKAHDALCRVDDPLPDFGDRFARVFQPCLGLISTRVDQVTTCDSWPLERPDLDAAGRALLDQLAQLPPLDGNLFGERGYQTHRVDKQHLVALGESMPLHHQALYTGTEVTEFRRLPARLCVNPANLSHSFRGVEEWQEVRLWVRQTARFPICALADGSAFRNSIIAGFENDRCDRYLLLSYLNSTPVRWLHFHSQRDARQGMPQLKVAHLRALPQPPVLSSEAGEKLTRLGRRLGHDNRGVSADDRRHLDAIVSRYFGLSPEAIALVRAWGETHPPPVSRADRRAHACA